MTYHLIIIIIIIITKAKYVIHYTYVIQPILITIINVI